MADRKRKTDDLNDAPPRKRYLPCWKQTIFPEVAREDQFDNLDLTVWAPSNEPDVLLVGGDAEFPVHKKVLESISSVWKDMLDGDRSLKEIKIKNVHVMVLEDFYKIIYCSPDTRKKRSVHMGNRWVDALKMASKYDIPLLKQYLKLHLKRSFCSDGKMFHRLLDCCTNLGYEDIAKVMRKNAIRLRTKVELEGYESSIIVDMIEAHDFIDDFSWFEIVAKHMKEKQDEEIKEALKKVGAARTKSTSLHFRLEMKKTNTLLDLLCPALPKFYDMPSQSLTDFSYDGALLALSSDE